MSWSYFLSAFGLGTFKYLFAHSIAYGIIGATGTEVTFFNLFIPAYAGAFVSMLVFYFLSDFFMDRAKAKKAQALKDGEVLKVKKKFTKLNKALVKIKMKSGIYVFTFVAPLFLSIPIGSIVCAKFYGNEKKTFPLMVLSMAIYGVLLTAIFVLING